MKTNSVFVAVFVLAVSVALSGCVGQSGGAGNNTGASGVVGANWCPAGATTQYTASGGVSQGSWRYLGFETLTVGGASVQLCCIEGAVTSEQKTVNAKVCYDQQGKYTVNWQQPEGGGSYAKILETYPKGNQTCMKAYDPNTGEATTEFCQ